MGDICLGYARTCCAGQSYRMTISADVTGMSFEWFSAAQQLSWDYTAQLTVQYDAKLLNCVGGVGTWGLENFSALATMLGWYRDTVFSPFQTVFNAEASATASEMPWLLSGFPQQGVLHGPAWFYNNDVLGMFGLVLFKWRNKIRDAMLALGYSTVMLPSGSDVTKWTMTVDPVPCPPAGSIWTRSCSGSCVTQTPWGNATITDATLWNNSYVCKHTILNVARARSIISPTLTYFNRQTLWNGAADITVLEPCAPIPGGPGNPLSGGDSLIDPRVSATPEWADRGCCD